uniref:SMOOTH MUSCLE MYOSIN HEAVY CHAIN/SMOOTH protein, smooth muscle, myosin.0A n=1 Tax=Myoviridae sp. ctIty1 TaxID=2827673 RepID=A0A8S5THU6_9CAUD|nr:MAG TPA: SMOOTH MUSCLE MYOSIN HEAVY CHAIN/SMOOTH protein, smooth muscle, myosin.0A [Myoviridae sp. ctIty1]
MLGLYTTTQYRALESQYKKADKLAQELQEKVDDLESQIGSSQLLNEYKSLKEQHDALVTKEAIEAKTIEALDIAIQDYKTKIASINTSNPSTTTLVESKAKMTDVAKELNKYKDEIKDLKDKVIKLSKDNSELTASNIEYKNKVENLNKDFNSASLNVAKAEKKANEVAEINRNLMKSLTDLKFENENLTKDKNALTVKEAAYKNRIAELEAEAEKLRKEASAAKVLEEDKVDASKGEVVTIHVKQEDGVVFKANGKVIKDFVQFYKGSSVTIECYKDGKLSDSFILEED